MHCRLSVVLLLMVGQVLGAPVVGGPTHNGKEVMVDLPVSQRLKNVGGMGRGGPGTGVGLCVWTSMNHAAFYQNIREMGDLQKRMMHEPGGGHPGKVDQYMQRWYPNVRYVNYEGSDTAVLELALKTGRYPAVTYCGQDPHYRGQKVSHMVNLVYLDQEMAAILDNNFVIPDEKSIVWMSRSEFLQRWKGYGNGWAVIFLAPPPVPVPRAK